MVSTMDRLQPIERPEALFDFVTDTDRGESVVFVGRDTELRRLGGYLRSLQNKFAMEGSHRGDGHTVLFEACPGMGKTALLAQFRHRAELAGLPAIRITHRHLTSFEAFASRLKAGLDSTVRRNRNAAAVRVAKALLPGVNAMFGADAAEATAAATIAVELLSHAGQVLKRYRRPPLAITIDEAALLDERHRDVLVEMHEGTLDWPILPVLAGTHGARQALKRAGVYRLGRERHVGLECLLKHNAHLAFPALCDVFGIGLEPDDVERWASRIATDSNGFPQHVNVGLVSAAEELLAANEQGRAPDIKRAAAQAARRRDGRLPGPSRWRIAPIWNRVGGRHQSDSETLARKSAQECGRSGILVRRKQRSCRPPTTAPASRRGIPSDNTRHRKRRVPTGRRRFPGAIDPVDGSVHRTHLRRTGRAGSLDRRRRPAALGLWTAHRTHTIGPRATSAPVG